MTQLRPLRKSDLASLSAWLPDVAKDVRCDRWSSAGALRAAVGAKYVLTVLEDGPAGLLTYDLAAPSPGAAHVTLLAVDPARRRRGIGGRAALALERRLRRSVARIYACVPARLGLALYFWLRLGYRPLMQAESPAQPEISPSVWMVRELRR